jgi:putative Mg2+ transporter-C (MgtC) family protein
VDIGTLDLIGRVTVAAVAGAVIGLERELREHNAGVRTHALVAIGAAVFTLAGAYGFSDVPTGPNVDPARVAAQVAAGIGFIGAGAILKIGVNVRGLTTAGTLWMAAALGLAAGAGAYALTAAGAIAVLVVVVGLDWVKIPLFNQATIVVEYEPGHGTMSRILAELEDAGTDPGKLRMRDDDSVPGGRRTVGVRVRLRDEEEFDRIAAVLRGLPEVHAVHWSRDT